MKEQELQFKGKIIFLNTERGFGFIEIEQDENTQVFFHIKALEAKFLTPKIGEKVDGTAQKNEKGWQATLVSSPVRRTQRTDPNVPLLPTVPPKKVRKNNKKKHNIFANKSLGKIVEWNKQRGFGFITSEKQPNQLIFFHISHFEANENLTRPAKNTMVLFTAQFDTEKKHYETTWFAAPDKEKLKISFNFMTIMSLVVGVIYLAVSTYFSVWLGVVYCVLSLILFGLYLSDKQRALHYKYTIRTPEAVLHLLAILGGWCGGLFARHLFRHKTAKRRFIITFWLTIFFNFLATLYYFLVVVRSS